MNQYDKAAELCPAKQVTLDKANVEEYVVIYDIETAGFRREQDILQVRGIVTSSISFCRSLYNFPRFSDCCSSFQAFQWFYSWRVLQIY